MRFAQTRFGRLKLANSNFFDAESAKLFPDGSKRI
jgi:hypothetical protein